MTHNVMSVVALATLCSSSLVVAQDAPTVEDAPAIATDAPTKTEWIPPGSFHLQTNVKKGVLKFGAMTFDTTIAFDGRPQRGETYGQANMHLLSTQVERNDEGQERIVHGRYVISEGVITRALRWLDPAEGSMEHWARRAGVPAGTEMTARVASGAARGPQQSDFITLTVTFDGTKVNQSIRFAGQEISAEEVKQVVAFLKATQRELEAFSMSVCDA